MCRTLLSLSLGLATLVGVTTAVYAQHGHGSHGGSGHAGRPAAHAPARHTPHLGMHAPVPARTPVSRPSPSNRIKPRPAPRPQPIRPAVAPSARSHPIPTARPGVRLSSAGTGTSAPRPPGRAMPTSRRPNPVNASQRNVLSAVPSQRMGRQNLPPSPTMGRDGLSLFGGGDGGGGGLGALGDSLNNFASNPGQAISNSPVGQAISGEAQKAGSGVTTAAQWIGGQASAGAGAISKGASQLPSLGNAPARFGSGSAGAGRLQLPSATPNPGKLGKQLGTVASGVPTLPTGLGKGPTVANPSLRVPTPLNWAVNGGKHALGQAGSLGKQGMDTAANFGKQTWGRGPVMADPTPPGWNTPLFPHATMAHGITWEVNGETYHIPFKGEGKIFGIPYELGMRNYTGGDLFVDYVFGPAVGDAINPFLDGLNDLGEYPLVKWVERNIVEMGAEKIVKALEKKSSGQ